MKSLKERQAVREKERKEAEETREFPNAEFLRNARSGKNEPGKDDSKGSVEGSEADATASTTDDVNKTKTSSDKSKGSNFKS